jgi:hypothetical protein
MDLMICRGGVLRAGRRGAVLPLRVGGGVGHYGQPGGESGRPMMRESQSSPLARR